MGPAISGGGGLTKQGSGTLTLTAAETYTGATTVNAGALKLGAGGAIAASSGVNVAASEAGFDISAAGNQTVGDLAGVSGGAIVLGGNTLTAGAANSTGFAGVISGIGGLVKQGNGALTLSGANIYTGATTINAGTLALGAGGSIAASSGLNLTAAGVSFNIAAGGIQTIADLSGAAGSAVAIGGSSLAFGTANSTVFAGSFTGTGNLTKQGAGMLTLIGDSSAFAGTTTITAGTLAVGSQAAPTGILGGTVDVLAGGALIGHGTVGTLNNLGGVVMPGGSIGVLTVMGNYTQSPSGILIIEVTPSGSSELKVTGTATLSGTLDIVFAPGTYKATDYNFVSASQINGSFTTVTGNTPVGFINGKFDVATGDLLLVSPTNDTVYSAMTSTLVQNAQEATATILDRLSVRLGRGVNGIQAADQAAPAASMSLMQLASGSNLGALDQVAEALPQALADQGVWFRGVGAFASANGNATAPGFGAESGGFMAGLDQEVTPGIFAGLAAGYTRSTVQEHSTSNGNVNSGRVMVYGGGTLGGSLWNATLGYAHDSIETGRGIGSVGAATENHGANEFTLGGQWSLPIQVTGFGDGEATVTPKAGLQFLHLAESGFTETGAGDFNLLGSARGTNSFQPFIGLAAAQVFVTDGGMRVIPEMRLGYRREAGDDGRTLAVSALDGTTFLARGVRPSRDMLTAGFGLTLRATEALYFFGNYDSILRTGNTIAQTVAAGLKIKF